MQGNKQRGKNFGKPLSASSLLGCVTAITNLYFVFLFVSDMLIIAKEAKGQRFKFLSISTDASCREFH
jgi:hypothetical protein